MGHHLGFDRHIGLHAHHAQGLLHGLAEHRSRHITPVVSPVGRLVNHHSHHNAGVVDGGNADKKAAVLFAGVSLAFDLVCCARFAAY